MEVWLLNSVFKFLFSHFWSLLCKGKLGRGVEGLLRLLRAKICLLWEFSRELMASKTAFCVSVVVVMLMTVALVWLM